VLQDALRNVVGNQVQLVDSADTTAVALRTLLEAQQLTTPSTKLGSVRFMATDGRDRFARVAAHFLHQSLASEDVELVEPTFSTRT
jgi:glutamate racemase